MENHLASHQLRLVVASDQSQKILARRVLTTTIRCAGIMATKKKKKKVAKKEKPRPITSTAGSAGGFITGMGGALQ